MGRWMSPDWSANPEPVPWALLDNPQSLNQYGYVLNSPVSRFDPFGHAAKKNDDPCKDDPDHCVTVKETAPEGPRTIPLIFAGMGHHGLSLWSKLTKGTDAYRFFRMWATGDLANRGVNSFDWLHRLYNQAVAKEVEEFLAKKGVQSLEQLTTEQCKELARQILNSKAPGINQFLTRLEAANAGALAILRGIASGSTEVSAPILMPKIQVNMILCAGDPYCGPHELN